MPVTSAGILLYRKRKDIEYFLVHPGGPIWKNKDAGVWSIPKGVFDASEEPLKAALREFHEETGFLLIAQEIITLTPVAQKCGKVIHGFAMEGDIEPSTIKSNFFEMEWPPKSGRKQSFPEVDRGKWFSLDEAILKANPQQAKIIEELHGLLEPGR